MSKHRSWKASRCARSLKHSRWMVISCADSRSCVFSFAEIGLSACRILGPRAQHPGQERVCLASVTQLCLQLSVCRGLSVVTPPSPLRCNSALFHRASATIIETVIRNYYTDTSWTFRGSNPGGGEIFHTRPDRPWGPPSLCSGCRVSFPGVKL